MTTLDDIKNFTLSQLENTAWKGKLDRLFVVFPDGAELAEDGEADGADEADVDELAVAEAGGAVVHLLRRRQAQRLAQRGVGQEQPNQELETKRSHE